MTIQAVEIEDAPNLLSIFAPYVKETAVSFEYEVPSLSEFEDRIRSISEKLPYLKAVSESGEILGYAYAGSFRKQKAYDWSVETTVYVRQDQKRMGIGTQLYDCLEAVLKDIGVLNMNACIALPAENDTHVTMDSVYFHQRMGFSPVGTFHKSGYKFDTWYDMIWMEKMIGDHDTVQKKVRFGMWRDFFNNYKKGYGEIL